MRRKIETVQLAKTFLMWGEFDIQLRDAKTGRLKKRQKIKNLVCNAGRNAFAAIAMDGATGSGYTGQLNYLAVGTSTTAPAVTDTQLGAEVARTLEADSAQVGSVVTYDFSFGTGSANTTLREIGVFMDGTASANTGQMFDHASCDITKTSSDVLTIIFTLTIA